MRKIIFLVFLASSTAFGQERSALKTNLTAPISSIWSLQYEYHLTPRLSINATGFFRPKKGFPFSSQVDRLAKSRGLGITGVDFEYIFIDEAEIGVNGIAPELRYYLSDKENPWFLGLFGQFESFDMKVPASFLVRYDGFFGDVKLPVNFNITTRSGGLLIGKQWNFGRVLLDVVIIGPHFGRATKVDAEINQELLSRLSEADKEFLKDGVIRRFKLDETYYNVGVSEQSASINAKERVPYFGLRGLGFNLGYRF